jgi:hypothetical protein
MKTTLLLIGTLIASLSFGQCSELFISEYVEGWSNNKALEIYNPTGASIDLSDYMVIRYSNGSTTATAANAVQLTGTIGANDVYVAVIEKLDTAGTGQDAPVWDDLQAVADGFYCPDYNTSNAFYWNGNDAVVLAKGTVANIGSSLLVDYIGKIGEDPDNNLCSEIAANPNYACGWTTEFPYISPAGAVVTTDHSLIRKSTIEAGVTNPTISYFIALDEYDSIPAVIDVGGVLEGNWSTLGSHTCDCLVENDELTNTPVVSVYPNPSSGKFVLKGAATYSTIVVYNALGQNVKTISNNLSAAVTIDLKAKRGVYFVKLTDSNGTKVTKRVIIK